MRRNRGLKRIMDWLTFRFNYAMFALSGYKNDIYRSRAKEALYRLD